MELIKKQLEEKWQQSSNEIINDIVNNHFSDYFSEKYTRNTFSDFITGTFELLLLPFGYKTQRNILIKKGKLFSQLVDLDSLELTCDPIIKEQLLDSLRNSIRAHKHNRSSFPFIHKKNRTQEYLKDRVLTAIENLPVKNEVAKVSFDKNMAKRIAKFAYEKLDMISDNQRETLEKFLLGKHTQHKINIVSELYVFTKVIDRLDYHTEYNYNFVSRSKQTIEAVDKQIDPKPLKLFVHKGETITEKSIRDSISKNKSKERPVFNDIELFLRNLFDK